MTSQDTKNLSILQNYIEECWGLRDEDNTYLKERIFNPVIVPEYKNLNIDENFRATYNFNIKDIPSLASIMSDNDMGWRLFRSNFFSCFSILNISYNNYLENKMKVNKNEVKLKKVIENFYNKNFEFFLNDFKNGFIAENSPLKHLVKSSLKKEHINEYIIKIFEVIGKYKTSNREMKLVISFNYADWLLCSSQQNWSSCLNVERGEFWQGIPTLFGDDNRALLYITDGTKKSWNGIEVDSFIYRAWILLNNDNYKIVSKFYPTEPINQEVLREITKDEKFMFYSYCSSGAKSKYELKPICIKKDHLYITVYNDTIALNQKAFETEGKLYYNFGIKGGRQIVNFKSKRFGEVKYKNTYSLNLDTYKTNKRTINQDFFSYYCTKCGERRIVYEIGDESLCEDCIGDDYYRCKICDGFHKKTENNKKFKGNFLCEECFKKYFKVCSICGEIEKTKDIKEVLNNHGEKILVCSSCAPTHIVKCKHCGNYLLAKSKYHLHFKDYEVCDSCFCANPEYKNKVICSLCNEIIETEDAIFDYKETVYCEKCLIKERDKKQTFFEF